MATTLFASLSPRRLKWLPVLAATFVTGCATFNEWTTSLKVVTPSPATSAVSKVDSSWEPRLVVTRDPANNGAPISGLAGRVYLFGINGKLNPGEGRLDFVVYDVTKPGQSNRVDAWSYDKETLNKQLWRPDELGWGYTVFLPSDQFTQAMNKVKIVIRYVPETGSPLFAESTAILHRESPPAIVQKNSILNPIGGPAKE